MDDETLLTVPAAKTLNQEQEAASAGFFSFLFDNKKEMGITGPGGVGKTFLMGYLIDQIMPQYFNTCKLMNIEPQFESVDMTATTNKAAEVLSLDCGRPTGTIQSFLNLKVQENFDTGVSKLVKTGAWHVHNQKILFVDECSMIDTLLRNTILEGTQDCKIVYVGDHCQIAPITEPISPVFVDSNITWYELTQPMRTNVPELHALNLQLRTTVETGNFQPIKIVPGVIDLYNDAQMAAAVQAEFSKQTLDARILAYTNKRVVEYNDEIRWIRGLPDSYTVGEMLINNQPIPLQRYMLSVEEEVEILSIDPKIETIVVDQYEGQSVELDYFKASIRNRLGMTFHDVKLPVDRAHFAGLLKWLAAHKKWSKMYDLKKRILDLRQRDSSTFDKAQGSSLNTVYIDAANLSSCHNAAQAARRLYVGASRARKHVVFYGQLADKYGGFIL